MQKSLVRKGLVLGIIILLFGVGVAPVSGGIIRSDVLKATVDSKLADNEKFSCFSLLENRESTENSMNNQDEEIEVGYESFVVATVIGKVHEVHKVEKGIIGVAKDLKIKPLSSKAFHIGDNFNGSNFFSVQRFIGIINEDSVVGIAFLLWVGDWYYKPFFYDELVEWYKILESKYPDYIEVFKANELYGTGKVPGLFRTYDLYFVRITNESSGFHKPEVLFSGGPHGFETVGAIGLYWFTDWLMRKAFSKEPCNEHSKEWLRWLVDNREIYIEVFHNPHGFDCTHRMRNDRHFWDLNREADFNWNPKENTGGIWGSVNGRTLRRFVDNHTIRVGCDFHTGVRMLLYSWGSAHKDATGKSMITGKSYDHTPPDFHFFDTVGLILGDYIGDYGGDFNSSNVGPLGGICRIAGGTLASWGYGADVEKNPVEDPYVNDEKFGNYPGSGILWFIPEMSAFRVSSDPRFNLYPPVSTFGNDTIHRYGAEIRRYVLYQTDLAQPYIIWQPGTIENNTIVEQGSSIQFNWQVNGSLVVDHTYIQWGTDPDPIKNPQYLTSDHDDHSGDFLGGTGWDEANNGSTNGVTYSEDIFLDTPGDFYFVAKAQVDQIYANVLHPEIYGDTSYLRLIKERTNDSYYEMIEGTDGIEEIIGQTWWYSPIIHVKVCKK